MEELDNPIEGARLDLINLKTSDPGMPTAKSININVESPKPFDRGGSVYGEEKNPFANLDKLTTSAKVDSVALGEYSDDKRYSRGTRPGDNWEEQYAQNQSTLEKAFFGVTKGLNLAATTVAGSFGMLYGVGDAIGKGDITRIWDNEATQALQAWNEKVDREYLPNFYTNKESSASWYDTDNWMTANFLFDKVIKNSGFAVGAMLSGNVASGLIRGAGAAIGEAALLRSGLVAASAEAAAGVDVATAFKNYSPLLTNIARTFSQGKNLEVAEILKAKAISSISDLAAQTAEVARLADTSAKYINLGDKASRSIVALYSSSGEASMEALMGGNQLKQKLTSDYIDANGVEPTGVALDAIIEKVKSYGKTSFFGNLALLGITEYAQLPYLTGSSWKNSHGAIRNITRDVEREGAKLVEKTATTTAGKLLAGVKKYGVYVFDPKEGGQEIGQYALDIGASNYYQKSNKTKAAEGWVDSVLNSVGYGIAGVDETGKAVGALNSKEGMEGGIIGALTGGLMQARGIYSENKEINKNTKQLIADSAKAPMLQEVLKDRMQMVNRGVVLQEEQEAAVLAGDILQSKDLKTDLTFNYAMHKIKYGRKDLVLADIDSMIKNSQTDEEFKKHVDEGLANKNDTKEDFTNRLTELKSFVNNLDSKYEKLNGIYASQLVTEDSTDKTKRKYSDDAIEKMTYISTKLDDYSTRITELKSEIGSKNVFVDSLVDRIYKGEKIEDIDGEIATLISNSTAVTSTDKNELKKQAEDVLELAIRQKENINEYNKIVEKPENYVTNVPEVIEAVENGDNSPKETITIKTKNGERKIELGVEYALGKVTRFTKQGAEVYSQPRLIVLGENEDGTIKIKSTKTGDIKDVSPGEFANYNLIPSTELVNNKKYKFMEEMQNVVFENYLVKKKDGKPAEGRLEYSNIENSLMFAYKNEKGVVKRFPVDRSFFVAQKGYDKPAIRNIGTLTASQETATNAYINPVQKATAEDNYLSIEDKVVARNNIVQNIYDNNVARLETVNNSLSRLANSFEKQKEALESQLELESKTKAGDLRKRSTPIMLKLINTLSTLEEDIQNEIEALESDKEDIENSLPYLQSFLDDLESQPENSIVMVATIQKDIKILEDLMGITKEAIKSNNSLLEQVQDLLKNAFRQLNSFLNKLKTNNPTIPLGVEDMQEYLDNYLKEDGVPLNTFERKEMFAKLQELELDVSLFQEQLSIPKMTSQASDIVKEVEELTKGLKSLASEKAAKLEILNTFEKLIEEQRSKQEEARLVERNEEVAREAVGTLDKSLQIISEDRATGYEESSKKDELTVVMSGRPVTNEKPINKRMLSFGNKFHKIASDIKNNIRVVVVTAKTEGTLGLKGLASLITDNDENLNKDVVTAVFVRVKEDGTTGIINENGEFLSEEELKKPLNHVLSQVFPSDSLNGKYGGKTETMFRDTVSKERIVELTEQYKKWRKAQLTKTKTASAQEFVMSFGIPKYSTILVDTLVGKDVLTTKETDFDAKNPIEKTGLVSKEDLEDKQIINISTEKTISSGAVTFATEIGRVFANVAGGLIKLNNRLLSSKEAETVYSAVLQLSKIALDKGTLKNNKDANEIVNWLKTVVYWGIANTPSGVAKPAGYNNIWFQKVENSDGELVNRLFISGMGKNYVFSPSELEANKSEIIAILGKMYHNVSLTKNSDQSWNEKYAEITGFNEDGTPILKSWKNYQSYLLSSEDRKDEEIPLTTIVIPENETLDGNVRAGIYFTLSEGADKYTSTYKKTEIEKKAQKKADAEPTPTLVINPVDPSSKLEDFKLDGSTINMFKFGAGDLYFTADKKGNVEVITRDNPEFYSVNETTVDKGATIPSVIAYAKTNSIEEREAAVSIFKGMIKAQIQNLLAEPVIEQAPNSNLETQKVDIEKRRQEALDKNDSPFAEDTINTKYDAELKALENPIVTSTKSLAIEVNEQSPITAFVMDNKTVHAFKLGSSNYKITIDKEGNAFSYLENGKQDAESLGLLQKLIDGAQFVEVSSIKDAQEFTLAAIMQKTKASAVLAAIPVEAPLSSSATSKTEEPAQEEVKTSDAASNRKRNKKNDNSANYRIIKDQFINDKISENFEKLEEWIKKTLPNIPVYRVKNIIQATNGRQAWGMLHKGAIYLYENAEQGTAYHEVFEAVWAMATSATEKKAVIRDFKNKKGTYVDRFTGEIVTYANATEPQLREELAEEFRDYIMHDKYPSQPSTAPSSIIGKIFKEILDTLKAFFFGKDALLNTTELFKRIGNGYYAQHIPFEQKLSFASKGFVDINNVTSDESSTYRLENISATEIHQIMQSMTHKMLIDLIKDDKSIFNISVPKNSSILYDELKEYMLDNGDSEYSGVIGGLLDSIEDDLEIDPTNEKLIKQKNTLSSLFNNVSSQWSDIVLKHKEYLKSYNVQFDESDNIDYENLEKSKDEGYGDARQIDAFKKIDGGLKFFLSTIQETNIVDEVVKPKINNIGGITLLPLGSVYVDLLNQLNSSTSLKDMTNRLREAARKNPNYRTMFRRLFKTNAIDDVAIDYAKLETHDIQLIQTFYKAFVKAAPNVAIMFVLPSGEIVIGDSNSSGAAKDYRVRFKNNIVSKIRKGESPYIVENKAGRFVATDKLLSLTFVSNKNMDSVKNFLNNIGIEFTDDQLNKLKTNSDFISSINGIIKSFKSTVLESKEGLDKLNDRTLDISGRLLELAIIKARLETTEFEITYFNINGERSQTYIGTNWMSHFFKEITAASNIEKLRNGEFGYLLTDSFSKGSVLLDKLYNSVTGNKKEISENFLQPIIVDGTLDEIEGKNIESSRLSKKQRLVQETNMAINGVYMNLVPGDGAMQSAIQLHEINNPFVNDSSIASKDYHKIFKEYFLSELRLAKENKPIVGKGRTGTDLRFFKTILSEKTHAEISKLNQKKNSNPEKIYEDNSVIILNELEKYLDGLTKEGIDVFKEYGIITSSEVENQFNIKNISHFTNEESYTADFINMKMKQTEINHIIAVIELHKVLYSDPYQYSGELKRIKSFTSPRQIVPNGSPEINIQLQNKWEDPEETNEDFQENFIRETINGATISDVVSQLKELDYSPYEETDGGGYISDKALRYLKIKLGEWNDKNEAQYIYDIAFMKTVLNQELTTKQKEIYAKDDPLEQNNYTPIKPIVAGNKNMGRDYNDIVLDKFALFPISFKMMYQLNPEANILTLYKNMIKPSGTDYVIHSSGRKIGAEKVYELYDDKGKFNNNPFKTEEDSKNLLGPQTVLTIPLSIFGIQSEVPTKETSKSTQGSQPTKIVTIDFQSAGVPIDFLSTELNEQIRYDQWIALEDKFSYNGGDNLYKEIQLNQELQEARIDDGLKTLFNQFGFVKNESGPGYTVSDPTLTIEILKKELMNRELNDNIVDALKGYEKGQLVLEAIPSYQQIRNILYSIAHRAVVSTKLTGGQKVQVSSAMLESGDRTVQQVTNSKGIVENVYQSDVLKFYTDEDGKRTCEIMISRWFKSSKTDAELLEYFNNSPEGQKILSGVAFRIPTQNKNSIEVFKINKFLPIGYKDSVIVPSALVKKVGSDFDIDKLFMYLKNIYEGPNGDIKQVPYFGIGEEAKEKLKALFYKEVSEKIAITEKIELSKQAKQALIGDFSLGLLSDKKEQKVIEKFRTLFEKNTDDEDVIDIITIKDNLLRELEKIGKKLENLTNLDLQEMALAKFVKEKYRQGLDNAYVESFERLVSHPLNFKNLTKPNSAQYLINLTKEVETALGTGSINYDDSGNMLNRRFMSDYRHDLVTAKANLGLSATSQTGTAQSQKAAITIDINKINLIPEKDKVFIGDGLIKFKHYNQIDGKPTISKINDANPDVSKRNAISDIIGQTIDGYVDVNKDPWIMRLGMAKNVASTWLFLTRLGVPIRETAFFMNQPIIRQHLFNLEKRGVSSVFSAANELISKFTKESNKTKKSSFLEIPSEAQLKNMIGKSVADLSDVQLAQQLFIFDEFLKYSKMAEHLFKVTQATNFDTSTFNDPFLIGKKIKQIESARATIFSEVDMLLDSTFMGKLKDSILEFRDGYAEILTSDSYVNPNGISMRDVLSKVLDPFTDISDSDYIGIAKKAVYSLFDWAVQTDVKLNKSITKIMLPDANGISIAEKVMTLKREAFSDENHPLYNNYVLKQLELVKGESAGEVDNLLLSAKDTKTYDQNQIIFAFGELKTYLKENSNEQLYQDLIRLSILQSGLQNSKISFSSFVPFNDFIIVYNATLSKINKMPNLQQFLNTRTFERSNFNDSKIVPTVKENVIKTKGGNYFNTNTNIKAVYSKAMREGVIPKIIYIGTNSKNTENVITFTYSDPEIPAWKKKAMLKVRDYSYIKKGMFQKVHITNADGSKTPLVDVVYNKDKVYKNFVYKMINPLGDSIYAKEYYLPANPSATTLQASVINNGYEKAIAMQQPLSALDITLDRIRYSSAEVEDDVIVGLTTQEETANTEESNIENTNNSAPVNESSETFEEKKVSGTKELIRPKTISLSDWDLMSVKEQIEAMEQDKNCK